MGDNFHHHFSPIPNTLPTHSSQPVLPLHESTHPGRASDSGHELAHLSHSATRHRGSLSINTNYSSHNHPSYASDDEDLNSAATPTHMPSKKSKSRSPNPQGRGHEPNGSTSSAASPTSNGNMNGSFRERGKPSASLEISDSATQTAHLMSRSSFSLDQVPPPTPKADSSSSKGFFDLPRQDRRNFMLLVLLYFLQGIPMGLAGGSVPFLLKNYMSY